MQVHWDIPIDEKSVPAEKELADIDAFIEAQLRTGVLLDADEWQGSGGRRIEPGEAFLTPVGTVGAA
jgi:hypothetical protein